MVVSQSRENPNIDPKILWCYWDPKMVTLILRLPPPPHAPNWPAPNARSSECAAYSSVLVVVDVVEVIVLIGAGMHSLVVDVVEMKHIMGAGMPSLVSCSAVKNSNLAAVEVLYGCYDLGCARNMKMLRANRGGGIFRKPPNHKPQVGNVTGEGSPAEASFK